MRGHAPQLALAVPARDHSLLVCLLVNLDKLALFRANQDATLQRRDVTNYILK